jgi:DNA polymerase-3 subunit delta'
VSFEEIIGHDAAIELLRRALRSGRLPQALLFHGPEGVGKLSVAKVLATTLLCEDGGDEPCGSCDACTKIAHASHPDLLFVRRLPKERHLSDSEKRNPPMGETLSEDWGKKADDLSQIIAVYQIRALSEHASYAPRDGRFRVFIIDPADAMNAASQNALLKTLEEPPGHSIFVLVSSRPHLLLPTVRSRCFGVGFAALSAPALASMLEGRGMSEEESRARACLASGSPGRALALDLEALTGRREEIVSILASLAASPTALAEIGSYAPALGVRDPDSLLEGLELVEGLLRDAALTAAGAGRATLVNEDLAKEVERLGHHLGAERAAGLVRSVERLRGYLRFNVNRTILAESLLAAVAGAPLP